jgi:hypothetical protein
MNTVTMHIGDVRDVMARLPDGHADLLVTSPPFYKLRSYLPDEHEAKSLEIGAEPTPGEFLNTLYQLTAEWGRLVAEWGSICVELGDKQAGSGGAGGDYNENGLREGQAKFGALKGDADGGLLSKSMMLLPHAYTIGLAYGHNPLYGPVSAVEALAWVDDLRAYGMSAEQALAVVGGWVAEHGNPHKHPAGQWRIRNVVTWARPNPPVGSLGKRNPVKRTGDYKFRPACSYITVACRGTGRYFDLDAVRTDYADITLRVKGKKWAEGDGTINGDLIHPSNRGMAKSLATHAGAPPLDWHTDDLDGDWLWKLATAPYPGSHYATYPLALPRRLLLAMCPQSVCAECGWPRERIAVTSNAVGTAVQRRSHIADPLGSGDGRVGIAHVNTAPDNAERLTLGWTDCGHDSYRPGHVLDPFGGSGTTAVAAALEGRDATLIDLDARNVDLVRRRLAENVRIVSEVREGDTIVWTVEQAAKSEIAADNAGQLGLFGAAS